MLILCKTVAEKIQISSLRGYTVTDFKIASTLEPLIITVKEQIQSKRIQAELYFDER